MMARRERGYYTDHPGVDKMTTEEQAKTAQQQQAAEGYKETPEDVEKHRTLLAQQAQEKAQQAKEQEQRADAAESALSEVERKLAEYESPARSEDFQPRTEKAESQKKESEQSSTLDFGDDDEPITAAQLKQLAGHLTTEIRKGIVSDLQEVERQREQQRFEALYQSELAHANKIIQEAGQILASKGVIDDKGYQEVLQEAQSYIPLTNELGVPMRIAKLAMRLFREREAKARSSQQVSQREQNEQAQLDHAGNVAQPPGTSSAPPAPKTLEQQMQEVADEIAPDDPPVE